MEAYCYISAYSNNRAPIGSSDLCASEGASVSKAAAQSLMSRRFHKLSRSTGLVLEARSRKRTAYAFSLLAATALTACGGGDSASEPTQQLEPKEPLELTILHINDHHSSLDSRSRVLQLKTSHGGAPEAVRTDAGGFARVTAAIESLAKQSANVLKLHAGDAQTGTLYFNHAGAEGEADAAMMNEVCFDAFTVGNHEFDKGDSSLKNFIDMLHKGQCKTPVLSANVNFGANSVLFPARAPGYVNKSVVLQRGGHSIGVIGLTIAGKTKAASSPDADTTFEDETVAAQREIDALHAKGVNKIVLMSHIGYGYDKKVIAQLSGVSVVVGGDSHTVLGPKSLETYGMRRPSGAYPTQLTNKDGKKVCLVQAGAHSQIVGELKVSFDAKGDVTGCTGTPHVLIGDSFTVAGNAASDAQKAAILADVNASGFLRVTAPSASATATLKPFKDKVDLFSKSVVATAPDELCLRSVPGGVGTSDFRRSSRTCNALGDVSLHGGDIQQLVAQSYLEVANANYGGADISLQSGGGVHVPLSGDVTAAKVIEVLPFGNMLFRLDVTGHEVKDMLEDGMEAAYGRSGRNGHYPYTGGLRFDVDARLANGRRVNNIEVRDRTTGLWNGLDFAKTYRLFVPSFIARGGDGYATLAAVPAARRLDIGVVDSDMLQTYIDRQPKDRNSGIPVLRKLDTSLYSTKSYIEP